MTNSIRVFFMLTCMMLSVSLSAQTEIWKSIEDSSFKLDKSKADIQPDKFESFELKSNDLIPALYQSFSKNIAKNEKSLLEIELPSADGGTRKYIVSASSVMHPELAKKYPRIATFKGWEKDNRSSRVVLTLTPDGLRTMILDPKTGTQYLEPYKEGKKNAYFAYYRNDFKKSPLDKFECHVKNTIEPKLNDLSLNSKAGDCQLRRYRLALACTGEYAQYHGGTVESVNAAFAVVMARVNGIYERDLAITMQIIPENDDLIYFDGATDPYTNNNGGTMLGENQNNINAVIGFSNYDIGHVFSTGGGGIASLRSPCSNSKARGVTGLGNPIGDPFIVDYVCHEMGHQYGANHTQNNSCQRNSNTAFEPGSASTIMGYAGICNPNVQNNSDDYFHAGSIAEMENFTTNGNGNNCAEIIPLDNNQPMVTMDQTNFTIPVSTPFVLTAVGTDEDDDELTYCWEQMDPEPATAPPAPTNAVGPAFRSLDPTTSPSRYFPNLLALSNNNTPTWEVLPSVAREMNFRVTVRDNAEGGGCTNEIDVAVNVSDVGGPFLVTEPNTNLTWNAGETRTVTWDVAGTDLAPISCSNVDIYLSVNGGVSFPILLAEDVPNTGSVGVVVPDVQSDLARVQVICSDNIFFDISNQNFSIESPYSVNVSPFQASACQDGTVSYQINLEDNIPLDEPVDLSVDGLPLGVIAEFSENPALLPADVELVLSNLLDVVPGVYDLNLTVSGAGTVVMEPLQLEVFDSEIGQTTLNFPENGYYGFTNNDVLSWQVVQNAEDYEIEIATDPGFNNIFESGNSDNPVFEPQNPLQQRGVYYWRVKALNPCSESPFSETYSFQVGGENCMDFVFTEDPLIIPPDQVTTVSKEYEILEELEIARVEINLDISHSYLGDISAEVKSPQGTVIRLFDRPGVPGSNYGCSNSDMEVLFYDDAPLSQEDLEATCENSSPAIQGEFQPVDSFEMLSAEPTVGLWELSVTDAFNQDGGQVNEFAIKLCEQIDLMPSVLLANNEMNVVRNNERAFNSNLLSAEDQEALYVLVTVPQNGLLILMNMGNADTLEIGDAITQSQISDGSLVYDHQGEGDNDNFIFDLFEANGNWLPSQIFNINILEEGLNVLVDQTKEVTCFNGMDGEIEATPIGGQMPYEYSLNNIDFQDSPVFGNLSPGEYTVFIRDGVMQTTQSAPITLLNPEEININETIEGYSIIVDVENGTSPYSFSLDDINYQEENVFAMLANGDYEIFVKDANDCVNSKIFSINVESLEASANILNEITCNGDSDGEISLEANGGFGPFTFSIDGINFQDNGLFQGLPAGIYNCVIMDSGGMSSEISVELEDPTILSFDANGFELQITANADGGEGPYEYSIDDITYQSSNIFQVSENGSFTVYVRDSRGCVKSADVNINTPVSIGVEVFGVICFDDEMGSIEILEVVGGVEPYSYSLDGSSFSDQTFYENLGMGEYLLIVQDANGQELASNVTVSGPDEALDASVDIDQNNIDILASGGVEPYEYSIDGSTFGMSSSFTDLADGNYVASIRDALGCIIEVEFGINVDGIEEIDELKSLSVSPNPSPGIFNIRIELSKVADLNIKLTDMLGKEIISRQINYNSLSITESIDISNYSSGIYHLFISSGNKGNSYKLIKI